jgi:hypothetical protein
MTDRALTKRDLATLVDLRFATDDAIKYGWGATRKSGWVRPLDCGGFNGSHHSYTLAKLARRGLAERYKFGGPREKGSCRYRINTAGRAHLESLKR